MRLPAEGARGMSLSAERIAVADRAILQAFERSSVAWQAIPHWDVGDRGRGRIRRDKISGLPKKSPTTLPPTPLDMKSIHVEGRTVLFAVTLAQATAGTPDALLSAVLPRAVELSRKF